MAAEIFKNTFEGGMNQDLSKSKMPPNMYSEANNFRITTDGGESETSLENILGNKFVLSIPDTYDTIKIKLDLSHLGPINITIDGVLQQSTQFINSPGSSSEDLYNYIISNTAFTPFIGVLYNVYYNSTFVLISPISRTIIVDDTALGLSVTNAYIPAQQNLEVIGSTYINSDIYILTTNSHDKQPLSSYGQIWKLSVDLTTNTAAPLVLIYNNKLKLSTYNAIAPSAILGRYENGSIGRIYWTDFYNKLRQLNVYNPQAFAVDISLLDVIPSVDFDIPILQSVRRSSNTNGTPTGVYQCAYRLRDITGAVTNYSELSNMVCIGPGDENPAVMGSSWGWADYTGDVKGKYCNKTITWKVDNIDQDFDFIELVILFRAFKDESPEIKTVFDIPISGDSATFEYDDTQESLPVSLSEFLTLSGSFTHCKSITTKDNRLIIANIRNEAVDVDFDVRAFRSKIPGAGTNGIVLTNNGIPKTYANIAEVITDTTEGDDCINDYYDGVINPSNLCKYKPESTSPILGGKGVNVSYEFYTIAVPCDVSLPTTGFQVPEPSNFAGPLRRTIQTTTGAFDLGVYGVSNQNIPAGQYYPSYSDSSGFVISDGFKFPQINGLLRGYQRSEIYRFGIQFYDKSKNPLFVKWIGDIKMPEFRDYNNNSFYEDGITPTGIEDFRLSFTANRPKPGGSVDQAFVQVLGIEFTIDNLGDIESQISGYSIVRVKREESDKVIICQGYINGVNVDTNIYQASCGDGSATVFPSELNYSFVDYQQRCFFSTPNVCDATLVSPSSGMKLVPKYHLDPIGPGYAITTYAFYKYYNGNPSAAPLVQPSYNIDEIIKFGYYPDPVAESTGTLVANFGIGAKPVSVGNTSYYIRSNSIIKTTVPGYGPANGKDLYNIERDITQSLYKNMYGGLTFNSRSNNEYIYCGHFRPVRSSLGVTQDKFIVFNGDTFVNMYDSMMMAKNWPTGGVSKYAHTYILPVESSVNTDLRHGDYSLRKLRDDIPTWVGKESNDYNNVYSSENDIKKYIPKPNPYISNNEFINRIYTSDVKVNGELQDSWSNFKPLNYYDVEGSYGAINGISTLQDQVYFVQDKAFGKMIINPRTAITSVDGIELQLGRGDILDNHDYVSVEVGSTHQFSFLKSGYYLYFIDVRHKKIYQFSQNAPLTPGSDLLGMHSWCIKHISGNLETSDRPVYEDVSIGVNGIHGVFDYINNELLYTFKIGKNEGFEEFSQESYTLVFNEKDKVFTGFYSHFPKNYITNNNIILSADPSGLNNLYLHNKGEYGMFYGNYNDSSVTFNSNGSPEFTKVFNNLIIQTEVQNGGTLIDTDSGLAPIHETFNLIEVNTDHQSNSVSLVPMSNVVRFFRSWRLQIPNNSTKAAYTSPGIFGRMMDKYLKIKLSFTNNGNKRMIFHNAITGFKNHLPR